MNAKGVVLLNVLLLLLVMLFVAGGMLQLALGRAQLVAKHRSGASAEEMSNAVQAIISACLANWSIPELANCSPFPSCTVAGAALPWACISAAVMGGGNGVASTTISMNSASGQTYMFSVVITSPASGSGSATMQVTCNNCE